MPRIRSDSETSFERLFFSPSPPPLNTEPEFPSSESSQNASSESLFRSGEIAVRLIHEDKIRRSQLVPQNTEKRCRTVEDYIPKEDQLGQLSDIWRVLSANTCVSIVLNSDASFQELIKSTEEYFVSKYGYTAFRSQDQILKYVNIFPWDHSAVFPAESPHFLNASHIDTGNYQCIASESPLGHSLYSFWLTVFEHSEVIVNLTEFIPNFAVCYWPNKEDEPVELESIEEKDAIIVQWVAEEFSSAEGAFDPEHYDAEKKPYTVKRTFSVKKGDKEKTVTQLHYRHLADKSAPTKASQNSFLHFLDELDKVEATSKGKSLIHCNAGVGRTGMLTMCRHLKKMSLNGDLDKALKDNNNSINQLTARWIIRLRSQRMEMVQNEKQYEFVVWYAKHLIENTEKA